ncbi:MAG TPA: cytochrome c [Bacteroidia bacterium]|nr:cytochrome c [Bacteroidia bacterium]
MLNATRRQKAESRIRTIISVLIVLFVASLFIASCTTDPKKPGYEFMPDMYRSLAYKPNSINTIFSDSMTNRQPVAGTIPRGGYMPYPYPNTPEGYEAAGKELKNSLEHSPENLAEGKRLFEIFCIHCHGPQGMGDGSITLNGKFAPPPSYSGDALKDLPEGKMYHTLEFGKNMMGSHASQLTQTERWKIIIYVQTLQKMGATATADTTKKSS